MRDPVNIYVTSQSFRVKTYPHGGLVDRPTVNVASALEPFTTWNWDRIRRKYIMGKRYRYYNPKTHMVYLPRYYLKTFLANLDEQQVAYAIHKLVAPTGEPVDIKMIDGFTPKDQRQEGAINHLITSQEAVRGISLQTGVGKTVTSLAFIAHCGVRAMIGVQGLTDQWVAAALEWTNLTEDDVYVIKGGPSLVKLMTRIDKSLFPKLIIYSIGTLRGYSQDQDAYENYPSFDLLAEQLNVGIRIVDEGHLNFYTNFIMDLRLNVDTTVILTATFDVTAPAVKGIFDNHYPPAMRFGENMYKKYVHVTAVQYRSGHNDIPAYAYSGKDGYSQVKMETWLLSKKHRAKLDWIFKYVYVPVIDIHYINKKSDGQKLLVMCEKVEMCEYITLAIRDEYPEYVTNLYIGETEDAVFGFSDIIVATTRSAGTAKDIKNLRTVIQTSSVRSAPQNIQNLGRLRELPNGDDPEFVYLFNAAVKKQVDHHNVRETIFRPRAKSFKVTTMHC